MAVVKGGAHAWLICWTVTTVTLEINGDRKFGKVRFFFRSWKKKMVISLIDTTNLRSSTLHGDLDVDQEHLMHILTVCSSNKVALVFSTNKISKSAHQCIVA